MLLIALALMCLACSLNADKVADWYWDHKWKSERDAAVNLLSQGLLTSSATINSKGNYERGDIISFTIQTPDGPFLVSRYQPRPVEETYVQQAFHSGHLIVSYSKRFPNQCLLSPSLEQAKRVAHRPKPARMPDDKISRFVSLAGKVMAGLLLLCGIYTFRRDI
jgi:hypothetical protein